MLMFVRIIEFVLCKLIIYGLVIFGVIKLCDLVIYFYWLVFYDMIRLWDLVIYFYWFYIFKVYYYNLYYIVV